MAHRDCLNGSTKESLRPGDRLFSPNHALELVMQTDGNLVLYSRKGLKPLWASNSNGSGGDTAVMQDDGNFVIYAPGARAVFATNTNGNPGSRLVLQNDANLVIYDRHNRAIWASNTCGKCHVDSEDVLNSGEKLLPGYSIHSNNGKLDLILQLDGNLVLYDTRHQKPLWSTKTPGASIRECVMQHDGNFVMYDTHNRAIFATNTNGKNGATLKIQDDGNLCLYQGGRCHWASNTRI